MDEIPLNSSVVKQAEVQNLHQDGSLHLHTRSLKYGKVIDFFSAGSVEFILVEHVLHLPIYCCFAFFLN